MEDVATLDDESLSLKKNTTSNVSSRSVHKNPCCHNIYQRNIGVKLWLEFGVHGTIVAKVTMTALAKFVRVSPARLLLFEDIAAPLHDHVSLPLARFAWPVATLDI